MLRRLFNPHTLLLALLVLFVCLQYELWLGRGGVRDIHHLTHKINLATEKNTALSESNYVLQATIDDLKHGQDATEEQARTELGMVKPGEIYYQIVGGK